MIVSHSNKFIFLHIPKTAGTSVRKSLLPFANPLEIKTHSKIYRRLLGSLTPHKYVDFRHNPHWSLSKAKSILPAMVFDNYFKFCFVRHPVNWQYSMFMHILSHPHIGEFQKRYPFIYKYKSFEDYMRWRIDSGAIPQVAQMLNFDGRFEVDFVGRFENLTEDFNIICKRAGIAADLPFLNKNKIKEDYKITDKARQLVIYNYQDDFNAFGYSESHYYSEWQLNKKQIFWQLAPLLESLGLEYDVWAKNILNEA
jgi:hypothetical protein